jgi:signal-transduction protein with cAMP-binding, CBS, and nucleotidyltransferase domain
LLTPSASREVEKSKLTKTATEIMTEIVRNLVPLRSLEMRRPTHKALFSGPPILLRVSKIKEDVQNLQELITRRVSLSTQVRAVGIPVTVRSLARPDIVSLDKGATAKSAAELMLVKNVGSVVVKDSGGFVGIVTERDLIRKIIASGKDPSSVKLGEIMSRPLITIDSGKGLGEATTLMVERKIRRLLVTENGKIIGIFTQRDLQQKIVDVFRSITEAESLS